MDFTTIRSSLETYATGAFTFVASVGSQAYNWPIVPIIEKIWEVSGPAKFATAALPALGSAYVAHKLLNHNVSYSAESVAYLAIKGVAITALVASGMFTSAFLATSFGVTGAAFYAAGFVLPAAVVLSNISK